MSVGGKIVKSSA